MEIVIIIRIKKKLAEATENMALIHLSIKGRVLCWGTVQRGTDGRMKSYKGVLSDCPRYRSEGGRKSKLEDRIEERKSRVLNIVAENLNLLYLSSKRSSLKRLVSYFKRISISFKCCCR